MSDGAGLQQLIFFVVVLGGFYLLAVRPQRARAKALAQVRATLAPGVRVITTAGLHATVTEVAGDTVVLEIAPGVRSTFASAAIVRLLDQPTASPSADQPPADEQ